MRLPWASTAESLENRTLLAAFSPNDVPELIAAINAANGNREADTINLGGQTFTLTTADHVNESFGASGLPIIDDDLTISNGIVERASSGAEDFRIMFVGSGATAILDGVTIRGGNLPDGVGGGIVNQGDLTIHNSEFSNNETSSGGALNNDGGTLTITNSTISGNSASQGGGIYNGYGTVSVSNSTLSANTARDGSGIQNAGTLNVIASTVANNLGEPVAAAIENSGGTVTIQSSAIIENRGEGIRSSQGALTILNSTISGNSSGSGSTNIGIYVKSSQAQILNSTIANNGGFGIRTTSATALLSHSIIFGNRFSSGGGLNLSGGFNGTNNIVEDGSGIGTAATTAITGNPNLGELADNGGPTWTHALSLGSIAIDAGDTAEAPAFDQRGVGFDRVINASVDIGAFEFQTDLFEVTTANDVVDEGDGELSLREAIIAANASPREAAIGFAETLNNTPITLSIRKNKIGEDANATGDLDIGSTILIQGNGSGITTIDGAGTAGANDRVFHVLDGGNLALDGVTVTGGASAVGAGLLVGPGGSATISNSTVSGNNGLTTGGIHSNGTTSISNSTISGNTGTSYGGIFSAQVDSRLTVTNSTISGNTGRGINVSSGGSATITSSTVFGNSGNGVSGSSTTVLLSNSIVAANNGGDLSGTFLGGHNLIQDGSGNGSGATTAITGDPKLGPLADNGGLTRTHAVLHESPAIDAGDPAFDPTAFTPSLDNDQRGDGFRRLSDGDANGTTTIDIGAVESTPSIVVTTAVDENDGLENGTGTSLREAIILANTVAEAEITFDAALNGTPIVLQLAGEEDEEDEEEGDGDDGGDGDLDVTGEFTITGNGSAHTIIDAGGLDRVFHVADTAMLSITDVTITNGSVSGFGGGILNQGNLSISRSSISDSSSDFGGGIFNDAGSLSIVDSVISNNGAGDDHGGGIASEGGDVAISGSTITDNSADTHGGGVAVLDGGTLAITDTVLSGNSVERGGGAIHASDATVSISRSTISGNDADDGGGGIYTRTGTTTLTNTVVSGNTARSGAGGIHFNGGTATVIGSTIHGNSASSVGGIESSSRLTIRSSTISHNSASHRAGGLAATVSGNNERIIEISNSTISGNSTGGDGGGLSVGSVAPTLSHVTIANNHADGDGGGLSIGGFDASVQHSLIIGNTSSGGQADIYALTNLSSSSYNLIGDADSSGGIQHGVNGNIVGHDGFSDRDAASVIEPLGNNGGVTSTHALVARSPAIDAGDPAFDPNSSSPPISEAARTAEFTIVAAAP